MASTFSVTDKLVGSLPPIEQTCPLLRTFPDELVLSILRHILSVQDLRACSLSCKQLNVLIQEESLWRSLFQHNFPHEKLPPMAIPPETYKEMSKLHSNIKKGVYSSMVLRGGDPFDQVLCLTQANGKLVSGSANGMIEIWDCQTGMHLKEINADNEKIHALAFADGKLFAAVGEDIQIWDYQTETCLEVLTGHDGEVYDLVVHNGMLFSASGDNTVRIWDLNTCECIHTLENDEEDAEVLALIVTNDRLISGTAEGNIHIWDLDALKTTGWGVEQVVEAHEERINAMALDEEGRLITCSDDQTIKVWNNYRASQCLHTLHGHTKSVDAFVRTGKMLISSSGDRTVRMWNYLTGECLCVLEIDSLPPFVVCPMLFSDGKLFSVLEDTQTMEERKIEIWNFKATEEAILEEIATLFKSQDPQDYTRAMTRFSRLPKGTRENIYRELESVLKMSMSKKPKTSLDDALREMPGFKDSAKNGEKAFHDFDGYSSSPSQKVEAIELYLAKQRKTMQPL